MFSLVLSNAIANQASKSPEIYHNTLTSRVDKGLFALINLKAD